MPRIYVSVGPEGRIISESLILLLYAKKHRHDAPDLKTAINGLPEFGPVIVKEES